MAPQKTNRPVSAIIPAAGFSSRMKRFKPLLPLGPATLIEQVISLFKGFGVKEIIVVTGHNHDRLAPVAARAGARSLFNPDYHSGMLSSIQTGVAELSKETKGFFLLPADIPAVRPATLEHIFTAFGKNTDALIVPAFDGATGHPPIIPARLIPKILNLGPEGNLRQVLFEAPSPPLVVHDRGILMDADTPEGYEGIKKQYNTRDLPTPEECRSIIRHELSDAPHIRAHLKKVAQTALELAGAVNQGFVSRGSNKKGLNLDFVRAGALLHDIKRKEKDHAQKGKAFIRSLGFPRVADLVGAHMDLDPEPRLTETQVVFFADKLCQGDRLSLDYPKRFRQKAVAHPHAKERIEKRFETCRHIHARIEGAARRPLRDILG